jgi:phosphoglycolate/pyridoxal phosphate phosphatase family enzyme
MQGSSVKSAAAAGLLVGTAFLLSRRSAKKKLRQLLHCPPPSPDTALLSQLQTVVFDCDGVLYYAGVAIPGMTEALTKLRAAGKRLLFVTNAAAASRKSLAAKLTKLGVPGVQPEDCITSASAAAAYLSAHCPEVKRAYVLGGGGLIDELRDVGVESVGVDDSGGLEALIAAGGLTDDVDAVVVGAKTEGLCYAMLAKASAYARDRRRPFIGTNPDTNFPAGLGELIPAGGCNVTYVAYAAERPPDVIVGKPSRDLAVLVAELYGLKPSETLMVGDRCNTDMAFGNSVGWHTMLVLSGCHGLPDVACAQASELPSYVAASVVELASCLD